MDSVDIYFLLLLAIFAGWLLGRLGRKNAGRSSRDGGGDIFEDYFVGLNYLLNDEPDEAIDTFIKALEINSETIETHLALGALLRRRGKVDKAIKVHQALLARPGLEQNFFNATRLQLAIDYISAGLLDRAERLLNEIIEEDGAAKWEALPHLITIYQTEKEWEKAIACCQRLLKSSNYKKDSEIHGAAAHYCCELAEQFLSEGQSSKAKEQVRRAFSFDRKSVRASFIIADIEKRLGNYKAAVKELLRIRNNNPQFISQLLQPLAECYEQLQDMSEYEKLLMTTLPGEANASVVLALTELLKSRSGDEAAVEFLNDYLAAKPSLAGLVELLKLQLPKTDEKVIANLGLLQELVDKLLNNRPGFQCDDCGYQSRTIYWLCPSCQKWDRIKPVLDASS